MEFKVLINSGRQISMSENLNYFAQADHIYIMDNHLGAIWCWDKLPKDRNITVVHIDAHYDLGCSPPGEFIYGSVDLEALPIDQIVNFKHECGYNYFMWDNYIRLFIEKYPNLINEFVSITQGIGDMSDIEGVKFNEFNIWDLSSRLWHKYENRKILNIDIDYFFKHDDHITFEIFSTKFISFFSRWLLKNKDNFDLITIALSPECCGSWDNSVNMANRILKPLNIKIEI
ncbi:UPF0489 family protein [Dyadobacter chenwenxiniae]|uniref:UPF0489 family protein n=1 Tax=Dyadobacter chenwenxiniae TaxID=2906456 RepID=A0A9X1TER5_9BACT|nr:UPF0489 family protein [Dyadobacter chenwenxiniae]MCF0061795.1 UPF0489 family protein [Dyadobacter chenwenxiniae]UON81611.1 UPF0489 family protein [Dyadobacter chenwenxiniae]